MRGRGLGTRAPLRCTKLARWGASDASPRSAPCALLAGYLHPRSPLPHLLHYPLSPIPSPLSPSPLPFDPRLIDDLARRLAGSVPESVMALRRDLEQNFKGVLQSQLAQLDLVTREEFDVQATVLKRTREKLAALEARLAELEKQA